MLIVDSQVHIWRTGPPTNPAHRQINAFSADDLLKEMDEAGVDRAVINPPGWDPSASEIAIEAARQHPNRLSVLGHFPLDKEESRSLVEGWKQQPGMRGFRFQLGQTQVSWLTDGTMDWLWPAAARAGLPVGLGASSPPSAVGQIAERHPDVRITIDHMGRGLAKKDDEAFENLPEFLTLAKYPNVAVKVSAVPSYSSAPYPYSNIHKYIRQVYDAFGPERMFWGTDITRMPCSWRQCVTLFTEELPWLSEGDKEMIMGQSLCKWIDWPLPA